jgi:hypothetical protein
MDIMNGCLQNNNMMGAGSFLNMAGGEEFQFRDDNGELAM